MWYRRAILAGLSASIVMGIWEMVAEQLAGGNGFWAPVTYIAATVLRDYQEVAAPVSFAVLPVVLGLMAHMMNSIVLGIVFALVVRRMTTSLNETIGLGAVFGAVVMLLMWLLVDPVMLRLNALSFLMAHVMWGIVLGLSLGWGPGVQRTLSRAHV